MTANSTSQRWQPEPLLNASAPLRRPALSKTWPSGGIELQSRPPLWPPKWRDADSSRGARGVGGHARADRLARGAQAAASAEHLKLLLGFLLGSQTRRQDLRPVDIILMGYAKRRISARVPESGVGGHESEGKVIARYSCLGANAGVSRYGAVIMDGAKARE
ncbi:hypothetical protein OH77DRAFT_590383 [Trametes cingulata]|nr:hypothetical protein OH77DRAFT_590383 [Trametes cingulata]